MGLLFFVLYSARGNVYIVIPLLRSVTMGGKESRQMKS